MMLFRSIALLAAAAGCVNAFVTPSSSNGLSRDFSLNAETVRKKEFVASMAEELGCTKTDAEASLACVLEMISDVSCYSIIHQPGCHFYFVILHSGPFDCWSLSIP